MHSESGDNDGDDDEPVRELDEMTVTGTHHRQVGEVVWGVHCRAGLEKTRFLEKVFRFLSFLRFCRFQSTKNISYMIHPFPCHIICSHVQTI